MNIKQEKKKMKLNISLVGIIAFVFGGGTQGRDKDLKIFTIGITLLLWSGAVAIGTIVYIMGGTDMVYLEMIVKTLMIASVAGIGITLISTLANNDFNSDYGWGLWWRALIYNILSFGIFYSIHSGVTVIEQREKVTSFELITSDIDDCTYMVKMKSKTLVYEHCSDYSTTTDRVRKTKDLNAYLVGAIKYGTNKASHFEFVDKKIMVGE